MSLITMDALRSYVKDMHTIFGMPEEQAAIVADIFVRATLRGAGHHDIYDFPSRIEGFKNGHMKANAEFQLLSKYEAMERYDGDNGSGELACAFIMDRATSMAERFGIGLCTMRNSNHYLAAAPFNQIGAEKGCLNILYTRTPPSLSNPQGTARVIGTSPMGFAAATEHDYPILLDVCLAYLANSAISEKVRNNESVPPHFGKDKNGRTTIDPKAIGDGGFRLPIGGHKGFGLAMLTEILTGILSGGQIIDEPNPGKQGIFGIFSHTAIAIKADALMPMEEFTARTTEMLERMVARDPDLHIPGAGSHRSKLRIEADGGVELSVALLEKLNGYADELGVARISARQV